MESKAGGMRRGGWKSANKVSVGADRPKNDPIVATARIYCDWANHYLDKSNFNRLIIDLQTDLTDGVLLADVICAVTNSSVSDINPLPTSPQEMSENVTKCLNFLDQLGIDVREIHVDAIRQGRVKSILQLFFNLSRFKQQQKSSASPKTACLPPHTAMVDVANRFRVEVSTASDDNDGVLQSSRSIQKHGCRDETAGSCLESVNGVNLEAKTTEDGGRVTDSKTPISVPPRTSSSNCSSSWLAEQTAALDAMNGNIESVHSRLPKKRLPPQGSRQPTPPTRLTLSSTHIDDDVAILQLASGQENNVANNNNVNDTKKRPAQKSDYKFPEQLSKLDESCRLLTTDIDQCPTVGAAESVAGLQSNEKSSPLLSPVTSDSDGLLAIARGTGSKAAPSGSGSGMKKTRVIQGAALVNGRMAAGKTTTSSQLLTRSVTSPFGDDSLTNRKSLYDNVETTATASTLSAANRMSRPPGSRFVVSASSAVPPGGGSGATSDSGNGVRIPPSKALTVSCDDMMDCGETCISPNAVVAGRKPSPKSSTSTTGTSMCRPKSVTRSGIAMSRRPVSDGASSANVTNLLARSSSGSAESSGSAVAAENFALKPRNASTPVKQRTLSLPVRSSPSSSASGLPSPSSTTKISSNILDTCPPVSGVTSPSLTQQASASPAKLNFGVRLRSVRNLPTVTTTASDCGNCENSPKTNAVDTQSADYMMTHDDEVFSSGDTSNRIQPCRSSESSGERNGIVTRSTPTNPHRQSKDDRNVTKNDVDSEPQLQRGSPDDVIRAVNDGNNPLKSDRMIMFSEDQTDYLGCVANRPVERPSNKAAVMNVEDSAAAANHFDELHQRRIQVDASAKGGNLPKDDGSTKSNNLIGKSSVKDCENIQVGCQSQRLVDREDCSTASSNEHESFVSPKDFHGNCDELDEKPIKLESSVHTGSVLPPPMNEQLLSSGKVPQPMTSPDQEHLHSNRMPTLRTESFQQERTAAANVNNPSTSTPTAAINQLRDFHPENTALQSLSGVPVTAVRVVPKSYTGRKGSREILVRPMLSICETPETGTSCASPVEKSFFDSIDDVTNKAYSGLENDGRYNLSAGKHRTEHTEPASPASSVAGLSPTPDQRQQHSATGRSTALMRSSSDRTQNASSRDAASPPQSDQAFPESFYPPQNATTTHDAPWWWMAAEKTEKSCRSSTLPRTVRDSVEQRVRITATAGAVADSGAWRSVANGVVDGINEPTDRLGLTHHGMSKSFNSKTSSSIVSSGDVKNSDDATLNGFRHEVSALSVYSIDVNGQNDFNQQQQLQHQTTVTRQQASSSTCPRLSSTVTSSSKSTPTSLTPKQLCSDAERLSNYTDVRFRCADSMTGTPYPRKAMTSPKPVDSMSSCPEKVTSKPAKTFRERWLASDGSSTDNMPEVGIDKHVLRGVSFETTAKKMEKTESVLEGSHLSAGFDKQFGQQRDGEHSRSRRKHDVSKSTEQLPASVFSITSATTCSESLEGRVDAPQQVVMTGSVSRPCRSTRSSTSSTSSGTGNMTFDDDIDGRNSPGVSVLRGRRLDYCNSDTEHRSKMVTAGRPVASNSVPRGMSLCASRSTSCTSQTTSEATALGGTSTTSVSAGLCTTCSGPSPKRSASCREDDWHGSMLSLISNTSSVYSTAEEKQAQEVRKLKRELEMAQEKISTLTMQLNTNVHVVTAFEKSLSNMTQRLQKLASSSDQKDSEINQLKSTLRSINKEPDCISPVDGISSQGSFKQKISLGSQPAHDKRIASEISDCDDGSNYSNSQTSLTNSSVASGNVSHSQRHHSLQVGVAICDSKKHSKISWLKTSLSKAFQRGRRRGSRSKKSKPSSGRSSSGAWSDTESEAAASSVRSSAEAALSAALSMPNSPNVGPRQLHPSSGSVLPERNCPATPSVKDTRRHVINQLQQLTTAGNRAAKNASDPSPSAMTSSQVVTLSGENTNGEGMSVDFIILRLQQQLREKDLKLTDVRLEALSSAHQLDSLRDTMNSMKNEIASLKSENERMQRLLKDRGLERHENASSTMSTSMMTSDQVDRRSPSPKRISLGDPARFDGLAIDPLHKNAQKIALYVQRAYTNHADSTPTHRNEDLGAILIGDISLNSATNWETLDSTVRRLFKKHIRRLDPGHALGLSGNSILLYKVGDIVRSKGSKLPDLLPCGYLVGDNNSIFVTLKGPRECCVDSLSFETLIAKSVVQRYVSQLVEYRRVIICGPTGTGKTYLARKLADTLVLMSGRELTDVSVISTFNLDQKSGRELRQYLASVADQCLGRDVLTSSTSAIVTSTSDATEVGVGSDSPDATSIRQTRTGELLPVVVVLDNLQHVGPVPTLADSFQALLGIQHQACPYIIGTMVQTPTTSGSSANSAQAMASNCSNLLQIHHNFRWIMYSNHVEPVAGFLSRHLQRRLVAEETRLVLPVLTTANSTTIGTNNTLTRRRQYESRCPPSGSTDLMVRVIDWLPRMWQHVNRFIETHCGMGSDVTIGPRLFMSCPMDYQTARQWFTDLWNYSIIPYLIEVFRDGAVNGTPGQAQSHQQSVTVSSSHQNQQILSSTGSRRHWQDPTDWVVAKYPWTQPPTVVPLSDTSQPVDGLSRAIRPLSLLRLRPEDLGYIDATSSSAVVHNATDSNPIQVQPEASVHSGELSAGVINNEAREVMAGGACHYTASLAVDPLTNMLLRLQEAAGCASPVPSIEDCSSDASTGSGSMASDAVSHHPRRKHFNRHRDMSSNN